MLSFSYHYLIAEKKLHTKCSVFLHNELSKCKLASTKISAKATINILNMLFILTSKHIACSKESNNINCNCGKITMQNICKESILKYSYYFFVIINRVLNCYFLSFANAKATM